MSLSIRIRPPVYISRTATETVNPKAPSGSIPMVLKMPKKEIIQKNTDALLKTMRDSALFAANELDEASKSFSGTDLATDKGLAEATEILCHLVANVIRPAMLKAAGHMGILD